MSRHRLKSGTKPKLVISSEKRKRARLLFDESPSKRSKHSHNSQSDSGRDTRSPEPNCPICLGRVEGKCFAHGCFHSFCRTCLSEWAKVKAECPVCREPFDKIIFNVKSLYQYDEVPVPPRPVPPAASLFSGISFPLDLYLGGNWPHMITHLDHITPYHMPLPGPRSVTRAAAAASASSPSFTATSSSTFRNPHTIPASPNISMSSFSIQIDTDSSSSIVVHSGRSHRHNAHRTGDHSYGPTASTSRDMGLGVSVEDMFRPMLRLNPQPARPGTMDFRRHIYRADLWVKFPVFDSPRRECSAEFYHSNIAATFRLHEFIRRDLRVMIRSQNEVTRVQDLITSALITDDIRSRSFRRRIESHTLTNTDHFIHELYCFAVSSIETLEQYDLRSEWVNKSDTRVRTTIPAVPPLGFMYELNPDDDEPGPSRRRFEPDVSTDRQSSAICITLSSDESDDEEDGYQPVATNRPAASASATVTSVDTQQPQISASPDLIEVEDVSPAAEEQLIVEPVELDDQNLLSINVNFIEDFDNPTPGPSGINTSFVLPINLTNDHYDESDSDTEIDVGNDGGQQGRPLTDFLDEEEEDEVKVVGLVKARHERTPEVFDLSDDDEDDGKIRTPDWDQQLSDVLDVTTKLEQETEAKSEHVNEDEENVNEDEEDVTEVTAIQVDISNNGSGDSEKKRDDAIVTQVQNNLSVSNRNDSGGEREEKSVAENTSKDEMESSCHQEHQ